MVVPHGQAPREALERLPQEPEHHLRAERVELLLHGVHHLAHRVERRDGRVAEVRLDLALEAERHELRVQVLLRQLLPPQAKELLRGDGGTHFGLHGDAIRLFLRAPRLQHALDALGAVCAVVYALHRHGKRPGKRGPLLQPARGGQRGHPRSQRQAPTSGRPKMDSLASWFASAS